MSMRMAGDNALVALSAWIGGWNCPHPTGHAAGSR
jgi:hypothetical protein